jgi:hypothetical protein
MPVSSAEVNIRLISIPNWLVAERKLTNRTESTWQAYDDSLVEVTGGAEEPIAKVVYGSMSA